MTPWELQDERENGAYTGAVVADVFGNVIPRGPWAPLPVVVSYGERIESNIEQKGEGEA